MEIIREKKKANIVDGGGTMKLYKVYTPKQAAQLSGELCRAFVFERSVECSAANSTAP